MSPNLRRLQKLRCFGRSERQSVLHLEEESVA